ncbi:MAG: hypothetical protein RJB66_632 [Pseudomonadota bacterium]|jgi:hypothetical protein
MTKKAILVFSLLFSSLIAPFSLLHARAKTSSSSLAKGVTPIKNGKKKGKPRRLYLDFSEQNDSLSKPTTTNETKVSTPLQSSSGTYTRPKTLQAKTPIQRVGFSNDLQIGYSNSAYRYAGEDYPERSIGFLLNPVLESSCFDFTCRYYVKMTGELNLNDNSKGEISLFQFGIKIPTEAWLGSFRPTYALFGVIPTTKRQLQVEQQLYGVGASLGLTTTPSLFDNNFLKFTGGLSFKKNVNESSIDKAQSYVGRQFLMTDFMFSENFYAEVIFGHINGVSYDGSENELIEMSQSLNWQATEIFSFSIGHGNTGPMFNNASHRLDPSLVSIDNSVLSFALGITNQF